MKLVSYYQPEIGIEQLQETVFEEYILAIDGLSRLPLISQIDATNIIWQLRQLHYKIVIEWDLIMDDSELDAAIKVIDQLSLSPGDVIRAYDVGAINYLKYTSFKIQPILEVGNNNLKSINKWIEFVGQEKVDRLVLSYEFSAQMLRSVIKTIAVPAECLIAGNIPLFYSPRKLLGSDSCAQKLDTSVALAQSQESSHKGFKVLQSGEGTIIFNSKDLFLLDKWSELVELKIEFGRIDLRYTTEPKNRFISSCINKIRNNIFPVELQDDLKVSYIRGFFGVNKTDVLFDKLKNQLFSMSKEHLLGEIVDHKKKEYMVIKLLANDKQISVGDEVLIVTPEHKEKVGKIKFIKSIDLNFHDNSNGLEYIIVNHISGACARTRVFIKQ